MFTRIFFSPSSHAILRAICSTADLDVLYDTHAWSCIQLSLVRTSHSGLLTLFVILPDMDAMRIILPPRPNRAICRPAACAVNSTPVVFTSSTYAQSISTPFTQPIVQLTSLNCWAGYSKQSVCAFKIPAAAMQKSNRCSLSPISSAFFHSSS